MRQTLVPGAFMELRPGSEGAEGARALVGVSERVYRLGATPIGIGAQAEVWPALRDDGVQVAIKVSHAAPAAADAVAREADLLDALAAAGFTHAVRCLDRVTPQGRAGFVMPLYGADADAHVRALIAETPATAIEVVLRLAAGIARALGALHELPLEGVEGRVVHRDLKPENLLVGGDGGLLLADFGGSLVVDGAGSLDLGVFGSPMWAPFDQMLPGLPEPNATWDTYACGVMLFWWITNGRPEYQADPWPMLTERGRVIWAALCGLAEADEAARKESTRRLFEAREGARAAELVDVRGHAAIQDADRVALAEGVRRLADVARYGETALAECAADLADLLARCLSPLSHPSPPNRYWRANDLVDDLEGVVSRLVLARAARASELERAGLRAQVRAMSRPRRLPWMVGALALGGGALLTLPAVAVLWLAPAPQTPAPVREGVPIASGTYTVGDVWGDGEDDERPIRSVTLDAFRIQRTEVSNADYRACVTMGVCPPLAWQDPKSPLALDKPGGQPFRGLDGGTFPAVGVTWQQAATWCAWRGGRLPSEEEWEVAATAAPAAPEDANPRNPRGEAAGASEATEKRRWPWGSAAPDCTLANYGDCGLGGTLPVDSLPAGASAWGALHLAGNVWEWTSSSYTVTRRQLFRKIVEEHRVLRGGSHTSVVAALRPTFRRHVDPLDVSEVHGFRCVYDEPRSASK